MVLFGSCGCFLINGNYKTYVKSISFTGYHHLSYESVTSTAVAFSLMMMSIGIAMRLGLHLAEITHHLVIIGGDQVVSTLPVFFFSFMANEWFFVLYYGILFGLFAGFNFILPIY